MKTGKACAIFAQIDSDKYTDNEKGAAILQVLKMQTHNGVTKDSMLCVINYLLRLAFDITGEVQEGSGENELQI